MIRLARQGEGCLLHAVQQEAVQTLCKADYTQQQLDIWTSALPATYEAMIAQSAYCVVYEHAQQVAGYASLRKNGALWHLYVKPDFSRRGIGAALLNAVEDFAHKAGHKTLSVQATLTALPFYQKQGYQVQGASEVLFQGVPFSVVVCQKQL